jgi:hypothetical protein
MGIAAKFLQLDRRDRALAMAAARALASTWIGLHTVGFRSVSRKSSRVAGQGANNAHSWCGPPPKWSVARPTVERVAWAVRAASTVIPGASNCLVRALATQAMLARYGYSSDLRIGARKAAPGALAAHAWLESAGTVVIGEVEMDNYVPLTPPGTNRSGSPA